ncbi:MAG: beta-galactosidase [Clostridia bacterium]|nr:beta-galactosidase [Clostridia bacterium]
MNIPRPEYPRPQLVREPWINLNGKWEFEIDNAMVGFAKKYYEREHLDSEIIVPFCPESVLSGIGNVDYMNAVWYKRELDIPAEWKGKSVLVHFGAVDYFARVWVNGKFVGEHRGGYTPFSVDITDALKEEGNSIVLYAEDDTKGGHQPVGKQSQWYYSAGCSYTRTTGIWQTVFMEAVDRYYVKNFKVVTDIETVSAELTVQLNNYAVGCRITAEAFYNGVPMGIGSTVVNAMNAVINLPLLEKHLWEVGDGKLYDLKLTVEKDGVIYDTVTSYFGLRSVALTNRKFLINGRSVFGRWVLDQGFYPDGIYTAPNDEALKKDIELSMQLGFNGARLHQKIFEPRFLYWADVLGYLVWGEHGNWGIKTWDIGEIRNWLPEWMESVERDFNHPSLIGWCPFNETWDNEGRRQSDDLIKLTWQVTKAMDPTRPVIDTSGNFHVGPYTDIFDIHDYDQNVESYTERIGKGVFETFRDRQKWHGQPFFVSEYGGIGWSLGSGAWGYGNAPKTAEEFIARYKGLTEAMLNNPDCCAFCYTQLYDVEQEQNGLMSYDRQFKFDPKIFFDINTQKAAIEE